MEGTAEYVYQQMNLIVQKLTNKRAWITLVEVRENEKNSAKYIP
jgi:6-pyruvoyltetrahydropterin/6-carboxytetrahydropterin synthase